MELTITISQDAARTYLLLVEAGLIDPAKGQLGKAIESLIKSAYQIALKEGAHGHLRKAQ